MMEANDFVIKLKAKGTECDLFDLTKVYEQYKVILAKLPKKDRATFSLNVLCTLCRNLESLKWKDRIDNKALLTLCIECVRETRAMERANRVKTLVGTYHVHRHVVRTNKSAPPELILKLSFMPFEVDTKHLLNEGNKTYWNLLADRLTYIERMKSKIPIIKLLNKLTEDVIKVIEIYDLKQFCKTILVFLIKKLYLLYTDVDSESLNKVYGDIFNAITSRDLKIFENLTEEELLELYTKISDCYCIIAENSIKIDSGAAVLESAIKTGVLLVGKSGKYVHCLQTYLSSFSAILKSNMAYQATVLRTILTSIDASEQYGYKNAMIATYPYLNQFLRLFINYHIVERQVSNKDIQEICLKLILKMAEKLKYCKQLLKCEGCAVETGLHDSLRLSFLVKHFVISPITDNIPIIEQVIQQEYQILNQLKHLQCVNYVKCFRKVQTDLHNAAVSLNKSKHYQFSIKLFEIYLKNEVEQNLTDIELKNVSRALYNKSICELEAKLFRDALYDAFLSLVFAGKDGLSSDKYMSLVMDIKSKEVKAQSSDDGVESDEIQLVSILDAVNDAKKNPMFENMREFFENLDVCILLEHEFDMYCKLWPSAVPVAGVWVALLRMSGDRDIPAETRHRINWKLYEVILKTCSVVRVLNAQYYKEVIYQLVEKLSLKVKTFSADMKLVYASLLLLKTECDLSDASKKYAWKLTEPLPGMDPDLIPATRTLPQESVAVAAGLRAVRVLTDVIRDLGTVSKQMLRLSLPIYEVSSLQLLHLFRLEHGLQMAYVCCLIAEIIEDNECYVRCAAILLSYIPSQCNEIRDIKLEATKKCKRLEAQEKTVETAIVFICEAAMYYYKNDETHVATQLVRIAQAKTLKAFETYPDVNLDLAVGKLLECQAMVCYETGPGYLTSLNAVHRHYLSMNFHHVSTWSARRLRTLQSSVCSFSSGWAAARGCCALGLRPRAGAAAAASLQTAAAVGKAMLYTEIVDVHNGADARVKIDSRIEHALGIQDSNENYEQRERKTAKMESPQELETMLENMTIKTGPTILCDVPQSNMADHLSHNDTCQCDMCQIKYCDVIVCQIKVLEMALSSQMKDDTNSCDDSLTAVKVMSDREISLKYDAVVRSIISVEDRILKLNDRFKFAGFILEGLKALYVKEIKRVLIKILIDAAFFELKCGQFELADERIVHIFENLDQAELNKHQDSDLRNLIIASTKIRSKTVQPEQTLLEIELENTKITDVFVKTPENKVNIPKYSARKIVNEEEIFKKRKVIKIDLDDAEEEHFQKEKKKQFKVPVPKIAAARIEPATPRPDSTPRVVITRPAQTETPISTPEQFFTPMTSMKTYTKKSLRSNIVKNLEYEFSTPKGEISSRKIEVGTGKKIEVTSKTKDQDHKERRNTKENISDNTISKLTNENKKTSQKTVDKRVKLDTTDKTIAEKTIDKTVKANTTDKKQVDKESKLKPDEKKRYLKRATSPGKLVKEAGVRTRRNVAEKK